MSAVNQVPPIIPFHSADLTRESSWYAHHHHHHHHHHHQLPDELVMYATPTPTPAIGKFGLDTSTEGYLNARYNGKRPRPRPLSIPDAAPATDTAPPPDPTTHSDPLYPLSVCLCYLHVRLFINFPLWVLRSERGSPAGWMANGSVGVGVGLGFWAALPFAARRLCYTA